MNKNCLDQIDKDVSEIISENLPWDRFDNKSILITGGTGFIGYYLVKTLLKLNDTKKISNPLSIFLIVRDIKYASKKFYDLKKNKQFNLIEWDLNTLSIPPVKDFDFIFHAASNASPKYYKSDPIGTILPNTIGTTSLLKLLKGKASNYKDKGFVFISSSEVYGEEYIDHDETLREEQNIIIDLNSKHSCYAESKRMGEIICKSCSAQFGIPTYIVRLFHTYGPGLSRDDGRVFADFIYSIIDNKNLKILGTGDAVRSFCYITDSIKAIFTVLLKGHSAEPYNVGNPNGQLSISQLAEILINLYPEKLLKIEMPNKNQINKISKEIKVKIPNIDKLKKLGWDPIVSPENGFKRTIDCQK